MNLTQWISANYVEIFGAVTGILYVFLEVRQNVWLWPVGIVTSAVYIYVFFTGKLYADMSLQGYYLVISVAGWYWWIIGAGRRAKGSGQEEEGTEHRAKGSGKEEEGTGKEVEAGLKVSELRLMTGIILAIIFVLIYSAIWFILDRLTDSPVPEWDSFITSLSIIATWMLARKIYEHWFLWIIINSAAALLFLSRGLIPTMVLYIVYLVMSFAGLKEWKKDLK